jgi:hypothetical protein
MSVAGLAVAEHAGGPLSPVALLASADTLDTCSNAYPIWIVPEMKVVHRDKLKAAQLSDADPVSPLLYSGKYYELILIKTILAG